MGIFQLPHGQQMIAGIPQNRSYTKAEADARFSGGEGTDDHAQLDNLDYASSGHTGFEPAKGADDNYVTDAQLVVIGNTSGTNTGDQTSITGITGTKAEFDTAVTDGNFLYVGDVTTNATHTGEVTGSGALAVDKTAITGKTEVTAVGDDYVLISDSSDGGNLKKALASDLTGAGGAVAWGSVTGTLSDQTDLQTELTRLEILSIAMAAAL